MLKNIMVSSIYAERTDDDYNGEEEAIPTPAQNNITCEVNGKTYEFGSRIQGTSNDVCQVCICDETFTDLYGPSCRAQDCGIMEYQ